MNNINNKETLYTFKFTESQLRSLETAMYLLTSEDIVDPDSITNKKKELHNIFKTKLEKIETKRKNKIEKLKKLVKKEKNQSKTS